MRLVLRPLARLESAMRKVREGDFTAELPPAGENEIGQLIRHFAHMRDSVRDSRADLESKVEARTEALDRLTKTDALTELLNRRGMVERIQIEVARAARQSNRFGILWLDLDRFKEINDSHGHASGDKALIAVAGLIRSIIRPYDSAARWGGDEFLVLVQDCDRDALLTLGERIRGAVENHADLSAADGAVIRLGVSVGAHLATRGEDLETILQSADKALYEAKALGRNRLHFAPSRRD
jgi:diguanylate cyclase (GGDEF)-like protein